MASWMGQRPDLAQSGFSGKGLELFAVKLLGEQHYKYEKGYFLTYYLCPRDYHRVHSPLTGEIESIRHLQGQLWPVNKFGLRKIPELFCLNERVVLNYKLPFGDVAVILRGRDECRRYRDLCRSGNNDQSPVGR